MDRTARLQLTDPPLALGGQLKKEFPLLVNNPDLVYLDNAASSQKPQQVLDALDDYYRNANANVHRSIYSLAARSTMAFENSRRAVQGHLNAVSPREIIFTRGTTEALNLLAWSLAELLITPGDIILLSTLEHHANFVPWQQMAIRKGASLVLIPTLPDATLNMDFLESLEQDGRAEKVKIASISHISNSFGTLHPVLVLSRWCRDRGIPLVLDAAQSLPHLKVDVQAAMVDFLVFSGHKVYGPMGSGVLWGRESWLERMPPWQSGGEMISLVRLEQSQWNELPYKFEAGTPDVAAAVGLAASLEWMSHIGMDVLEEWEKILDEYALKRLKSIEELTVYGPEDPSLRRGIFSFNIDKIHSHDVAQYLDTRGIAVRSGHHCTQPAMQALGIASTARASLAAYNTLEDIDHLVDAIGGALEYFR